MSKTSNDYATWHVWCQVGGEWNHTELSVDVQRLADQLCIKARRNTKSKTTRLASGAIKLKIVQKS